MTTAVWLRRRSPYSSCAMAATTPGWSGHCMEQRSPESDAGAVRSESGRQHLCCVWLICDDSKTPANCCKQLRGVQGSPGPAGRLSVARRLPARSTAPPLHLRLRRRLGPPRRADVRLCQQFQAQIDIQGCTGATTAVGRLECQCHVSCNMKGASACRCRQAIWSLGSR